MNIDLKQIVEKNNSSETKTHLLNWIIFLSVTFTVGALSYKYLANEPEVKERILGVILIGFISFLVGGIARLMFGRELENIEKRFVWVRNDGEFVFLPEKNYFIPIRIYKKYFNGTNKIDLNARSHGNLKIFPVSENPKVRHLNCCVQAEWDSNVSGLRQFLQTEKKSIKMQELFQKKHGDDEDKIKTIDPFAPFLEFHLYEFAEKNSKELAKFYNPKVEEQQAEFLQMLQNYFKELGHPLKITGSFDIN